MSASSHTAPVARKFINVSRKPVPVAASERLFTAREVTRILDITDRTLRNWVIGKFQARRPLEVVHPGGVNKEGKPSRRFMIAESELNAWLAEYRNEHNEDLYARWREGVRHVGRHSD